MIGCLPTPTRRRRGFDLRSRSRDHLVGMPGAPEEPKPGMALVGGRIDAWGSGPNAVDSRVKSPDPSVVVVLPPYTKTVDSPSTTFFPHLQSSLTRTEGLNSMETESLPVKSGQPPRCMHDGCAIAAGSCKRPTRTV
jgi:hypothetical protein